MGGDEIYESGDLSHVTPLQYATFTKSRENIDKKASIVTFLSCVVLPLFDLLGKRIPALQFMSDNVTNNFTKLVEKMKPDQTLTQD